MQSRPSNYATSPRLPRPFEPLESRVLMTTVTTYDPGHDFSSTVNPNGVWSYGETRQGSYSQGLSTLGAWIGSRADDLFETIVEPGTVGGQPGVFMIPGDVNPGFADDYATVRWTAPNDGSVSINGLFSTENHGRGPTADEHILLDTLSVWDGTTNASAHLDAPFNVNLPVRKGDHIDFEVGSPVENDFVGSATLFGTVMFSPSAALPKPGGSPKGHSGPVAVLANALAPLTKPAPTFQFQVSYRGLGVDATTVDNNDILVTGPRGFSAAAKLVKKSRSTNNGGSVVATYQVHAPSAKWTAADNGSYAITLKPLQVFDVNHNAAPPHKLGSFLIKLPKSNH